VPRKRERRSRRPNRRPRAVAHTDPRCYDHPVAEVRLAETHVSWVFLTGRFAYKVKKPVKLPFLDFSTLRRRHHYCREELRVNRRLAPELYLGVVPIGGSPRAPRIGEKPAFEYAVKMREFAADARLDRRLAAHRLRRSDLAAFAERLAKFHERLPAVRGVAAGSARASALANVAELGRYVQDRSRERERLQAWTERHCARLAGVFSRRIAEGAHRECHGDLHLQNLLWHDGAIMAFDALEFDRKLRDVDVISEAAFLAMDLCAHRRVDLAYSFLNRYLEISGDYGGVDVLRFYLVYRALVRAKVAAIKRAQSGPGERGRGDYLRTALRLATTATPSLIITHGLSGSGKTYVTDELVSRLPALRVRSDLERKRLHGLAPLTRSRSAVGGGIYAAAESRRTYSALAVGADRLLRDGHHAIVDATFLRRSDRLAFRQVAAANAARFVILDCTASAAELRRRIAGREHAGRDASEANLAVLEQQLREREPLDRAERRSAVAVDTEHSIRYARLMARLVHSTQP
jgi:hypothetical protein